MKLSLKKNIFKLLSFIQKNEKTLLIIGIAIVLLRFFWLNYINWDTGAISNGLHGIKHWLDTDRYLEGAEKLISGTDIEGRENQYLGYMAVIALTQILNLPLISIVIIQLITALVAAFALFDIAKMITKNKWSGLFAAALFLCNPFIVQWHLYILTESLYTSFVIFSFWSLAKISANKKLLNYIVSIIILTCTMFIRPNGWILLPVFAIFYFISFNFPKKVKLIIAGITIIIFVVGAGSINLFKESIQITTPVENLQKGVTVWEHQELYLNMPQEPNLQSDDWSNGIKYIFKHPGSSIKLGAYRAGYTLIHIRPYHSTKYKIRVLMWVVPAYLFALLGFWYFRKNKINTAALLIISGHLLVVALSYAEHDSRFDIYILPIFYALAGAGFIETINKVLMYYSFNKQKNIYRNALI